MRLYQTANWELAAFSIVSIPPGWTEIPSGSGTGLSIQKFIKLGPSSECSRVVRKMRQGTCVGFIFV